VADGWDWGLGAGGWGWGFGGWSRFQVRVAGQRQKELGALLAARDYERGHQPQPTMRLGRGLRAAGVRC
jgi:hypothetical protein